MTEYELPFFMHTTSGACLVRRCTNFLDISERLVQASLKGSGTAKPKVYGLAE